MFNSNGGYSLSDIAAATGNNGNNSGWGNDGGAWWIIILFLFAFCGWGNGNGFGNNGGAGTQGALTRGELCQDMNFADLETAVRGVQSGLCDGFYALNTGMLNGFSGVQNTLSSEFRGVDNAVCTLGYNTQAGFNAMNLANVQNTNAITSQLNSMSAQQAACCCETQRAIERGFADTNYNMSTQDCHTRHAIATSTRSILDFLVQDKISTLQAENQGLKLAASQAAQNNYLVSELRPCPIPAYTVPNPFCCNTGYNGCSFRGCGY